MKFSPQNEPLVLAHRGDTNSARENSADAIRAARSLGADGVEIDIRMTRDGHLVLAHEPEVQGNAISTTDLEILLSHGEIDLLEKGLAEAAGLVVNLEIKGPLGDTQPVIEALRKALHRLVTKRFLITSFWVPILSEAQKRIPDVSLGILSSAAFDDDGSGALEVASANGFEFILPSAASVSEGLIERAHSAGVSVIAWTENQVGRFEMFKRWGIDGVITDRAGDLVAHR